MALKAVMGSPAWANAPEFATLESRCASQDALDERMAQWTRTCEPRAAMAALQGAGVAASVVQNAEDLNEHDPQLAERGVFFELDHPVIGPARFEGSPMLFSGMKQINWRSGPLLGEDSRYVLTDILNMADEEVDALAAEGVI